MTTVQKWTGRESRALRHALRMSIRDFAEHLGVSERTVSKWEAGREAVQPRPELQAALDTALGRADGEVHRRFRSGLGSAGPAEKRHSAVNAEAARIHNATVAPATGVEPIADLTAVYRNRAELTAHLPADRILEGARDVRAMGLSLNLLCSTTPTIAGINSSKAAHKFGACSWTRTVRRSKPGNVRKASRRASSQH